MDNVCHTIWCSVGTTCHSKLNAAVDSTRCGENKWCLNGECVPVGFRPEAVDDGWSGWSAWSICSRSCGLGIQSAEQQCTQTTAGPMTARGSAASSPALPGGGQVSGSCAPAPVGLGTSPARLGSASALWGWMSRAPWSHPPVNTFPGPLLKPIETAMCPVRPPGLWGTGLSAQ
nr:A disintegrin and metalloproteinase with thrombospondin motifs 6-like [Macaca nemestrina]